MQYWYIWINFDMFIFSNNFWMKLLKWFSRIKPENNSVFINSVFKLLLIDKISWNLSFELLACFIFSFNKFTKEKEAFLLLKILWKISSFILFFSFISLIISFNSLILIFCFSITESLSLIILIYIKFFFFKSLIISFISFNLDFSFFCLTSPQERIFFLFFIFCLYINFLSSIDKSFLFLFISTFIIDWVFFSSEISIVFWLYSSSNSLYDFSINWNSLITFEYSSFNL